MFVVLEKNTLVVTGGGGEGGAGFPECALNLPLVISKCEFPLRGLNNVTDWTYGFLRVRIFIGEGRSQSGGR